MLALVLFLEFFKVGIFCVGGGYASMPLIQAAVVDTHHWLTLSEFVDIFTISQMTPGPIGINAATFAGMKVAGLGGAIAATLGFASPSLILGVMLAKLFFKYGSIGAVQGILNGLRPAVIALICSAGISFITLAVWDTETFPTDVSAFNPIGVVVLTLAFVAVREKASVVKLLVGSGILGLILGLIS